MKKSLPTFVSIAVILQACLCTAPARSGETCPQSRTTLSAPWATQQKSVQATFSLFSAHERTIADFLLTPHNRDFSFYFMFGQTSFTNADADTPATHVADFAEQLGIFSPYNLENIHTATREGAFNILKHAHGRGVIAYRSTRKQDGAVIIPGLEAIVIDAASGIDLHTLQERREQNGWDIDYNDAADGHGLILMPDNSAECIFESRGLKAVFDKNSDTFTVAGNSDITTGTRVTLRWWGQAAPSLRAQLLQRYRPFPPAALIPMAPITAPLHIVQQSI